MQLNLPPVLSKSEQARCILALPEKWAVDKLVSHNLKLALFIARRYLDSGFDLEDLYSLACISLIKAVHKFDNSRGVAFSTFAVTIMNAELSKYLRDQRCQKRTGSLVSLDMPISFANGSVVRIENLVPTEMSVEDELGYTSPSTDARMALALALLEESDRSVVIFRHQLDGKTQREIGSLLGLSQVQVSRIQKKVTLRAKQYFSEISLGQWPSKARCDKALELYDSLFSDLDIPC